MSHSENVDCFFLSRRKNNAWTNSQTELTEEVYRSYINWEENFHYRSSRPECSVKNLFLEIPQNSQENTSAIVSFLIKLQAQPATLLKKRLWRRCFPVNFAKFLRTPFLTEHRRWLLLPLVVIQYFFFPVQTISFIDYPRNKTFFGEKVSIWWNIKS